MNDSSNNDNVAEETGTSALRSPGTRASGRCGAAGEAAAPPAAPAPGRASNEGFRRFHEYFTIIVGYHSVSAPPVLYDNCVGVPISRLLTVS